MVKQFKPALFVSLLSTLAACTHQEMYDTLQHNARMECQKLPSKRDYDLCMQQQEQSFDDYSREREAYLKERKQDNK